MTIKACYFFRKYGFSNCTYLLVYYSPFLKNNTVEYYGYHIRLTISPFSSTSHLPMITCPSKLRSQFFNDRTTILPRATKGPKIQQQYWFSFCKRTSLLIGAVCNFKAIFKVMSIIIKYYFVKKLILATNIINLYEIPVRDISFKYVITNPACKSNRTKINQPTYGFYQHHLSP